MKKLFFCFFVVLQSIISFAQNKDKKTVNLVITNVSVVSMERDEVLKNQDVVIIDGKIVSITKFKESIYKNILRIDGTGKFIMPSLSDAHVHFPETEAEMEQILQLNLINGVTKLRSMRGDWKHAEWRTKFNSAESFYPKLYLSSPPISRSYDLTPEQIESFVKSSKENGFDLVKILSIKSQTIFSQLESVCKKYNMPIGGHFPKLASGNQLNDDVVFNSNYTSFEHLGGLAGETDAVLTKRIAFLKDKNTTICPTLSWYSIGSGRYSLDESRNLPGMEFVSKVKMEEWIAGTIKYREKIGDEAYKEEVVSEMKTLDEKYKIVKKLHEAGVNMILSPDASGKYMIAGFGVLGEMQLLKNANLSNFDVLKMSTLNFAKFFKESYGTIEVGKAADFIILDKNPLEDLNALKDIKGVYFNNQFLDESKLKEMRLNLLRNIEN